MKKVIGLCLVVLLSSTSVFARENRREDKNAQMKKILTEEQYKQYLEKQQPKGNKHGRKHLGNGRR